MLLTILGHSGFDFFFFFLFCCTFLLSTFWTSHGHRCRPFCPPVLAFNFSRAYRVQQSHCSSIFRRVLLTHALALSASQLVHKQNSRRIYTSMHSGGFELTKLTYTRLEDNLIRHWGDRSYSIGRSRPYQSLTHVGLQPRFGEGILTLE